MVSPWAIERPVGILFECRYIGIVVILLGRTIFDYLRGVSGQTKDPDILELFVAGLWDNSVLVLSPMEPTHTW